MIWNLGTILIAVGVYFFKFPNHFTMGGVSGISVLLAHFVPSMSAATAALILNMVLLVVGYICIGRDFSIATLYCSILVSLLMKFFEYICPLSRPLTQTPILELCFAIILPGVGAALLFNTFASGGGTDIIALVLRKYTHIDISNALLASDILVLVACFFVFDLTTALMSLLGLIVKSFLVDAAIENINRNKYFTIITTKPDEIEAYIIDKLHRSGTRVSGQGIYTGHDLKVIYCVVNRYQAVKLREAICKIEPEAFVLISNTSNIIGKGFPMNQ